ncbi:ABC transporter permease [Petrocella sp. FN5]|uniref:ABC transporter permease n=1 Tax=Petrocella sp. FN5 TaxID=3032002 RepID=UPI0023DB5920|nr:ABC transporter permease subunit [Petrocella sp. FN5]MDF1617606.1 ABC transporter permease subunit [Petrocella sp. FN5]
MKKIITGIIILLISLPMILTFLLTVFTYYKYPQLLPSQLTFEYWNNFFFKNPLMIRSVLNSLFLGLMNGTSSTIVGFMAGRALSKQKENRHTRTMLLYSLPLFIPATALFIGVHLIMLRLSFTNTYLGVVLAHMVLSVPYSTNIGISFFKGIPSEMEQVARTIGCRDFNLFKKVILPLITPGLLFSGSICFLLSFSDYFAAALIGGGKVITLSALLYPYINNADYGNSATLGIVFVSINIGVFFITERITKRLTKVNTYLFE